MGMEMEVSTVATEDAGHQSVSSVRQAIVQALADTSRGETAAYHKLLIEWRDLCIEDAASNTFLQLRLKAMSQAVSFIKEREHEALLSYILGMSLWVHSFEIADALTEFTINLATVNGGCLVQCLDMLVRNFLPPSCGLPVFLDIFSRRALTKGMPKESLLNGKSQHLERKHDVLHRVHFAIGRIAELVPITTFHLQPIVLQRMPHRIVDKEWNALYLENMLRLDRNLSGELMRNRMLMAVIDRLIEVDVEIRWEDIVREDDSNKIFVFDMDLDETLEENDIGLIGLGNEGGSLNVERKQSLCVVADKMDVLMDMTLQHLQSCSNFPGGIEQVFNSLMSSFQSTILDTHKSKFTQFLVFYVCSLAPATCGAKFASLLCDILVSTLHAPNTRMSAAAYLASYLARANYLPFSVITSSLRRVMEWCICYTARQSDKKAVLPVDAGLNGVFYSACQAFMYVLCFRMRKLMGDTEQRAILHSLCIDQFLKHNLNPLKICLSSVVEEFLKQATRMHLVDCSVLHEFNKSMKSTSSNTAFGGSNQLDMFFPFDPYLLKQSDRFIRSHFVFWSMVQSQGEELVLEGEDEGNESGLDNNLEGEPGVVCRSSLAKPASKMYDMGSEGEVEGVCEDDEDMDAFEISMNRMSLTPGDKETAYLRSPVLPQVLPLPARLTPEMLLRYSRALV